MPIGNDEEAARTAQWAQSHKDDPRYPAIVQSLRDYDSNRGPRGPAYNPNDTPPPALEINPNAKPAGFAQENSLNLGPLATAAQIGTTLLSGSVTGPIKEMLATSIAMSGDGPGAKRFADNPPPLLTPYTPDDPYANEMLRGVGKFLYPVTATLDKLTNWTGSDSALAQAAEHGSKMVMGAIPTIQMAKSAVTGAMATSRVLGSKTPVAGDLLSPEDLKSRFNIDLMGSSTQDIAKQVGKAAVDATTGKGSAMNELAEQVSLHADAHSAWTKYLYQLGDDGPGAIRFGSTRKLMTNIQDDLKDYPLESKSGDRLLPDVDKITDDLGALFAKGNQKIPLSDIEDVRQRIGKLQRTSSDERSIGTLGKVKKRLDDWEDNEVNKSIIAGDKETFNVYKQARDSSREWHEMYSPNSKNAASKAISKLLENNATPEEIRGFIFGANATVGKAYSGNVIEALNKILGADAPVLQKVRQDVIFDVVKPLMDENLSMGELGPAINQFLQNYNKAKLANPTLFEKLMPYENTGLDQLYRVAQTVKRLDLTNSPYTTRPDLVRVPIRLMFGNSLAANNAHINLMTYIIKSAGTLWKSPKSQMMKDLYRNNTVKPGAARTPVGKTLLANQIGNSADDSQNSGTP